MIRKLVIVIICLMLIAFEQNCAQEESLNVDVCEPISGKSIYLLKIIILAMV